MTQNNRKVTVFIDGTWIWHNTISLNHDHQSKLDLGHLPERLVKFLTKDQNTNWNIVFCASIPINYDPQDYLAVCKRQNFFDMLRVKYHFTTEIYQINFHGRRINQYNRDPNDNFNPKEKCVDIATASNLFVYDYDIAILVTGDRDFLPAIKKVLDHYSDRKVVVASFPNSCSQELLNFSHPRYQVHLMNPADHQLISD